MLIPEINFAFATGTDDGALVDEVDDDVSLSGMLFQVGFRAGAEFHLEFLDVPQSTVQITVGLGLALELRGREDEDGSGTVDESTLNLKTHLRSIGEAVASGIQVFFYM